MLTTAPSRRASAQSHPCGPAERGRRHSEPVQVFAVAETRAPAEEGALAQRSRRTGGLVRYWYHHLALHAFCPDLPLLDEDIDALLSRLDKVSTSLASIMGPAVEEIKQTIQHAIYAGVLRPISFHPLMLGSHHTHFKGGVLVEVVRKNKRMDVLAAGGR